MMVPVLPRGKGVLSCAWQTRLGCDAQDFDFFLVARHFWKRSCYIFSDASSELALPLREPGNLVIISNFRGEDGRSRSPRNGRGKRTGFGNSLEGTQLMSAAQSCPIHRWAIWIVRSNCPVFCGRWSCGFWPRCFSPEVDWSWDLKWRTILKAAEKLWLRAKECACDGSISQVEATCRDLYRTECSFGWDELSFPGSINRTHFRVLETIFDCLEGCLTWG